MQYEPYGETLVQRGTLDFAPKYNSQELDRETNFYFYNARYYDPQIARFTSADTVIDGARSTQGWNRFSYVAGNPIGAKDPTGHELKGPFPQLQKSINQFNSRMESLSGRGPVDQSTMVDHLSEARRTVGASGKLALVAPESNEGIASRNNNITHTIPIHAKGIRAYGAGQRIHKYTTADMRDHILAIGRDIAKQGEVLFVGDGSLPKGGPTNWHDSHRNGLIFDMKMSGRPFEVIEDRFAKGYDQKRTEGTFRTILDKTLSSNKFSIDRIYFNDRELNKKLNSEYSEKFGREIFRELGNHDDHFHIQFMHK